MLFAVQTLVACVCLWFLVFILSQINHLGRTPTLKSTVLDMKRASALWATWKKGPPQLDCHGNVIPEDEYDEVDG